MRGCWGFRITLSKCHYTGRGPPSRHGFVKTYFPGFNNSMLEKFTQETLFQKSFKVWSDFQRKVNSEATIGGIVIDPFDVDSRLKN